MKKEGKKENLFVDDEMEMGEIEADADRLPLGVVEVGAQENALPLVEQTRVQVELAVGQLEPVESLSLSHRQQSVGQSGAEAERQVVAFVAIGLHGHERRSVEGHGRGVLAQLAVESVRALARELVLALVRQEGRARPAVQARHVDAPQQLHRTVFTCIKSYQKYYYSITYSG